MDRLLPVARSRGGVCTAAQAAAVGVDEHGLVAARREGRLVRVRRDAYVLGERWQAADPEERLVLRARAVLAGRGDDAAASHETALALHRLPLLSPVPEVIDLEADVTRSRRYGSVRVHPRLSRTVAVDGYRAVTAADAIAQVALRGGLRPGLVALDAALRCGRALLAEVSDAFEARATDRRAQATAETLLARADGRSESPGETLTRLLLVDLGYTPRSQVEVRDEEGDLVARVDLMLGERVVVEFDGLVKYGGADGREALIAEKRREDALRAMGYVVVRVTWADLEDPSRIHRLLRRALTTA